MAGVRALNTDQPQYSEYRVGAVTKFHGIFQGLYEHTTTGSGQQYIPASWMNLAQTIQLPGQTIRDEEQDDGNVVSVPQGNGDFYVLINYFRPRIALNPYYLDIINPLAAAAFPNLEQVRINTVDEQDIKQTIVDLAFVDPTETPDDNNPGFISYDIVLANCPDLCTTYLNTDRDNYMAASYFGNRPTSRRLGGLDPQLSQMQPRNDDETADPPGSQDYRVLTAMPRSTRQRAVPNRGYLQDMISPIERFKKIILSKREFLFFVSAPPVLYSDDESNRAPYRQMNFFGFVLDIEGYYSADLEDLIPYFQLSP